MLKNNRIHARFSTGNLLLFLDYTGSFFLLHSSETRLTWCERWCTSSRYCTLYFTLSWMHKDANNDVSH